MSEGGGHRGHVERNRTRNPGKNPIREIEVKVLAGGICAILGILFAAGGLVGPILGSGVSVSAGVISIALGIVAYFLDARRIGTFAVILAITALFFGLAASQGLIPGIKASDHGLPAIQSSEDR